MVNERETYSTDVKLLDMLVVVIFPPSHAQPSSPTTHPFIQKVFYKNRYFIGALKLKI